MDKQRFGGLAAFDTRRAVYGTERRAILTHSPELRDSQATGFDGTTLAKAAKKLGELARGKTRRSRDKVAAETASVTAKPWVRRVIRWELTGGQPKDLRLSWRIDAEARAALEEEIFGKHVLITSHDDWPVAEVVAGYRSQSEAEGGKPTAVISVSGHRRLGFLPFRVWCWLPDSAARGRPPTFFGYRLAMTLGHTPFPGSRPSPGRRVISANSRHPSRIHP